MDKHENPKTTTSADYKRRGDAAAALFEATDPGDILAELERFMCAKHQRPAPGEKDRLTVERWQEWVENAPAQERRAWAMDAVRLAMWLMEHKTIREGASTVTFPPGLQEVGFLVAYIEGPTNDRVFQEQNKFFMATENSELYTAGIEREDIDDSPNYTVDSMQMIPSWLVGDGKKPTIEQAIKSAGLTWLEHRKEYGGYHVMAKSVEAYVLRPTAIEPFKPKKRGQLPHFDKIEVEEAKMLIQLQPEPPPDSQLFLEFPELQRTGAASWLLNIYDQVGGSANQRGRGAPWSMRLFIGGLLHVPIHQRDGEGHYFPVPTNEVIRWLYPDGKWTSKYSRWESFTKALKEVNRLGWLSVPDVGSVHVFGVSVIPEKPSDPFVQFIARVPPSAAHGARIDWPKLCAYGKESAPLYRAYLTACEFMHQSARNSQGVTEVIGKALLKSDGTPIRKKGKIVRSKTNFDPNSAVRYVTGLTKAELTAAIGLDASVRQNQSDTMKAFERLDDDGVIDLQKKGQGKTQKFFLFAPNQWAVAHEKTLEKEKAEQNAENNTTADKK